MLVQEVMSSLFLHSNFLASRSSQAVAGYLCSYTITSSLACRVGVFQRTDFVGYHATAVQRGGQIRTRAPSAPHTRQAHSITVLRRERSPGLLQKLYCVLFGLVTYPDSCVSCIESPGHSVHSSLCYYLECVLESQLHHIHIVLPPNRVPTRHSQGNQSCGPST